MRLACDLHACDLLPPVGIHSLIALRGNANADVDGDSEWPQRNRTNLSGMNLHSLSDWMDRYHLSDKEPCLKRIMTTWSSVSICKMPKVHMQGSRARPMGRHPVLGSFWNDSLTEATQLKVPARSTNLHCGSPTFLLATD